MLIRFYLTIYGVWMPPPSKTNLISENWIDRAKTDQIVLNIDTRSFLDKTGLY